MHRVLVLALAATATAACANKPGVAGNRESGQSRLMGQTFAGANKCNPDNHLRPFIIEWDATDMSSFESYAANDIVFVKYEGCSLTVLDECRNDSVRGEQGAYRPPEWTSGSLETVDIANEGELYAKLPLGAASLGGRVSAGEQFHMEYYVAGTRNATRASVYRDDIKSNPGCEGATHFVYGYNLGAFALGSAQNLQTEAGASAYGFGVGGKTNSTRSAEKKGGDLGVCKADSATEVQGCKAPIRLTLREIRAGENPEQTAMKAPDTDESISAAMAVNTKVEMSEQAKARYTSAKAKSDSGDGKGCLAELDAHDKLNPKGNSQDPKNKAAAPRAKCLMQAGKCKAGKVLARKAFMNMYGEQYGAEHVDKMVEALTSQSCQGGNLGDRDKLVRALDALMMATDVKKEPESVCDKHIKTVDQLKGKVKPKGDDDMKIKHLATNIARTAPGCYVKAGNCKKAWKAFVKYQTQWRPDFYAKMDKATKDKSLRTAFDGMFSACKGKG